LTLKMRTSEPKL